MNTNSKWSNYQQPGRCARFFPHEKKFIRMMVNKFFDIIENKKSSNEDKSRTWDEITSLFNAEPSHTKRHVKHIKKCYENLKARDKALRDKASITTNSDLQCSAVQELPDVINRDFHFLHGESVQPVLYGISGYNPPCIASQYTQSSPVSMTHDEEEDDGAINYVDVEVKDEGDLDHTQEFRNNDLGKNSNSAYAADSSQATLQAQRIENQIKHDKQLHLLQMEKVRYEVQLAKTKLIQAQEETAFWREKWKIEKDIVLVKRAQESSRVIPNEKSSQKCSIHSSSGNEKESDSDQDFKTF